MPEPDDNAIELDDEGKPLAGVKAKQAAVEYLKSVLEQVRGCFYVNCDLLRIDDRKISTTLTIVLISNFFSRMKTNLYLLMCSTNDSVKDFHIRFARMSLQIRRSFYNF